MGSRPYSEWSLNTWQTSLTQNFSKEEFKKNVISNCKSLYRKNIEEANDQEVFQAVSYAVKDIIIVNGLPPISSMRRTILRWFIICLWSSLWDVHLVTT